MEGPASWSGSPRSGSSLTSAPAMSDELRCLIAAGGTGGHVLPALAVAEALRARGVQVTFAGSPDRVEARLVPEAGFELDGFRAQPLPRRLRELEAAAALASAPIAALGIVRRRRPHVVLGG